MAAAVWSFTLEQGVDQEFTLVWKDSDGVPISLDGPKPGLPGSYWIENNH